VINPYFVNKFVMPCAMGVAPNVYVEIPQQPTMILHQDHTDIQEAQAAESRLWVNRL
jgi:hypothetical protein